MIVRKLGEARLTSPNIARQQEMPADGQMYIAGAGDGAIPAGQPITLNVTGLPHHSRIAALRSPCRLPPSIVLIGIVVLRRPVEGETAAAERKRLIARREKLFQDLVKLEQDHRRGRLDAARYGERRAGIDRSARARLRSPRRRADSRRRCVTTPISTASSWSSCHAGSAGGAPSRR